ncbi:hypothetical protein J6590_089269 [Homalodisca vitripennis]|nr:hypothetical protein J6590_089269 [Homalodisca vitripennis]
MAAMALLGAPRLGHYVVLGPILGQNQIINMPNTDVSIMNRIPMIIPTFCPVELEVLFVQYWNKFSLVGVTEFSTKFNYVAHQLPKFMRSARPYVVSDSAHPRSIRRAHKEISNRKPPHRVLADTMVSDGVLKTATLAILANQQNADLEAVERSAKPKKSILISF